METNKIYNKDCIEGLKKIEDNSIDLLITDPPYNISQNKKIDRSKFKHKNYHRKTELKYNFGDWDNKSEEDFNKFTEEWLKEVTRVMKPKSWGYIFFAKEKVGLIIELLKKYNLNYKTIISWCKSNPTPAYIKNNWLSAVEFIIVFSKGSSNIKNFLSHKEMYNYVITTNKSIYGETEHPTEKPKELIAKLIRASSNQGEIVLDCFMGSGTTAIVCKELDRRFIGFEISEEYVDLANKRVMEVKQEAMQTEARHSSQA